MNTTTDKPRHDLWTMEQDVLMRLVFLSSFRPMTEGERDGFAGCESEEPLLGGSSSIIGMEGREPSAEDTAPNDFLIVLDGSTIQVMTCDGQHRSFEVCPS